MWKWTDADNIQAIILDMDSLSQDYLEYPFTSILKDVKVFKVKDFWNNDVEKTQDTIEYFDISSLLQEILSIAKCESYSLIAISSNALFLKEMMQNHIGTILAGELTKEFLKSTPDFTYTALDTLDQILLKERKGYGAEVFATYSKSRKKMSLLKSETIVQLENGQQEPLTLYFGGRYYSQGHQYLLDDPLSVLVKEFKDNYVEVIDLFFDLAINFINKKEKIDILTAIPLKPIEIKNKRFDRFASLHLKRCTNNQLELQSILKCNKDFSQKGNNLFNRKEIVKGAFEVTENIAGKSILLMDDVYSSGSTFLEVAKTLYAAGAKNVSGVLLAANQLTESTSMSYHSLLCSCCGKPMTLKINHKNKQMFFGCTEYQKHLYVDTSISMQHGLRMLLDNNKLEITEIIDLEDEY